ncbi:MAG: XdhC family protein [Granulosicoccus sp.]
MANSDSAVLEQCILWLEQGRGVELVTVARTWGSAPRPVGALAAVRDDGALAGSVSGGCVEKQLTQAFIGQKNSRVFTHRIDDAEARRYGLACGGEIELVFETLSDPAPLRELLQNLKARKRIRRTVTVGEEQADVCVAKRHDTFTYNGSVLGKVFGPSWRVLLIGAGELSRYAAEFALALDFDVVVCDPRPEFRASWSVPAASLLDNAPHEAVILYGLDVQTAVLALTHDPNLDDMALLEALPGDSFYVGALGSQRNYQRRCKRLSAILEESEISRLHGPVGLKIGSRTSAEIALSIVAELVQLRALISKTRI